MKHSKLILSTVVALIVCGLSLAALGNWLVLQGDTLYYATAGAMLVIVGVLLMRHRASALWLYLGTLILILVWSIYEVGANGWQLLPRLMLPGILGLWLCIPSLQRQLADTSHTLLARRVLGSVALLSLLFVVVSIAIQVQRQTHLSESVAQGMGICRLRRCEDGRTRGCRNDMRSA